MNVLHVITTLGVGGAERFLLELLQHLRNEVWVPKFST